MALTMDSQVRNGSGLPDEHTIKLLFFNFLQNCSNHDFHKELEVLQCELPELAPLVRLPKLQGAELQTDGNLSSHLLVDEADSERQEEIIQDIARQLAQIGDSMDRKIHPALVQDLAAQFLNGNLSEEEKRKCLTNAVQVLLQTYPKDMEQEKIMLTLTMLLAKKNMN